MKRKILEILIPAIVLLMLVVSGYYYYQHKLRYPETDDAYVKAHMVNIAAQVSGKVKALYVRNNQYVKKGQPLLQLEMAPFALNKLQAIAGLKSVQEALRAQDQAILVARARLNQTEAQLENEKAHQKRMQDLVQKGFVARAQADDVETALRVANANVTAARKQLAELIQARGDTTSRNAKIVAAQAKINSATLDLSYTTLYAPQSGFIQNAAVEVGATVRAYDPLFVLVEDRQWWVEANFKETQIQRIQPGQPATIMLDIYPDARFIGKVHSVSSSSGSSFSLLPAENASGNWVKVTQRFPVRVDLVNGQDPQHPLRVGASATVVIDTSGFSH